MGGKILKFADERYAEEMREAEERHAEEMCETNERIARRLSAHGVSQSIIDDALSFGRKDVHDKGSSVQA